ncbi:MAG: ACT domain-containing protein [Gammaproteobacteria bacterium]
MNLQERDEMTAQVTLSFGIKDRAHLARILRRLRGMPQVMRIQRTRA